jgi:hypothetical protein
MMTRKVRARQWERYIQKLERMDSEVQVDYSGWLRQGTPQQRKIWRKFKNCQPIELCGWF